MPRSYWVIRRAAQDEAMAGVGSGESVGVGALGEVDGR
jgi:hypothetical protein